MNNNIFNTANILMPKIDFLPNFCVVACDQYTSEPNYWQQVEDFTSNSPSALNLVFPEVYLKSTDFDKKVADINSFMLSYLNNDIFTNYDNSLIFVQRTLQNGDIRHGIVGVIDLEQYDYSQGSKSPIRATEGTVLDRIPPRVLIRQDASLELPHVMLLIDDPLKTVVEPLISKLNSLEKIYDFKLMLDSGNIKGYLLAQDDINYIDTQLALLADKDSFNARYNLHDIDDVLLFAVGDGNHSLATARQCYLNLKAKLGEHALTHPARYALVEVVNLHDSSLNFEAIHRVVFNVNCDDVLESLNRHYLISDVKTHNSHQLTIIVGDNISTVHITNPTLNLAVGSLQQFIDQYITTGGD